MKTVLRITLALLLMNCSKSDRNNLTDCDLQMIEKYKDEITCDQYPNFYTLLQKGTYKNETIYFMETSCVACYMAPPQKGSTCDGKEVQITNFSEVKEKKSAKACPQ